MSAADVIVPAPIAANTSSLDPAPRRGGLASIKTMFNTNALRRNSIAQMPSFVGIKTESALPVLPSLPSASPSNPSGAPHRRSMDKAAEKDRKEQAKQIFQLSTIDGRGTFLPPPPLEKNDKDEFMKEQTLDHFETIILRTPPERVRTFLSTASTISPGMFSLPGSKIKRRTIPTFVSSSSVPSSVSPSGPSTLPVTAVASPSLSSRPIPAPISSLPPPDNNTQLTPPSSPAVPPKDVYCTPPPRSIRPAVKKVESPETIMANKKRHQSRAQISFLTGSHVEDLSDALSDSMDSFVFGSAPSPRSPSQDSLPDLVADDGDGLSGSEASSTQSSPRYSTPPLKTKAAAKGEERPVVAAHSERARQLNSRRIREQNFGAELHLGQ